MDTQLFQIRNSAEAKLLVVIYHKYIPRRQLHLLFSFICLLKIKHHMEIAPFSQLALKLNASAHEIYNIFCN